jgi:capsid protein
VTDKKTGLPKVQSLEAHRIASPYTGKLFNASIFANFDPETRKLAKSIDGAHLQNGIVTGEYGEQLAIIVTDGTSLARPVALIPAGRYWHITEPEWFSENRGLPKMIYAIYDWYDLKETRDAEKIKQKIHSKLALTEDNSTGFGKMPSGASTNPSVIPLENGLINYYKSGSGNGLKFLMSNSPGDSWQRFLSSVEQAAFYAIGWNRALLDPSGLSSANMHSVAEQINYSIFKRFDNLEFFAKQELQWYVSGLIGLGKIPENAEWWNWSVAPPSEYAVNQSRNNQATLESLRAGTETHSRIIRAKGGRPMKWLVLQEKCYTSLLQTTASQL